MKKFYGLVAFIVTMLLCVSCNTEELPVDNPPTTAKEISDFRFIGVKTVDAAQTKGVAQKSKLWYPGTAISIKFLYNPSQEHAADLYFPCICACKRV